MEFKSSLKKGFNKPSIIPMIREGNWLLVASSPPPLQQRTLGHRSDEGQ